MSEVEVIESCRLCLLDRDCRGVRRAPPCTWPRTKPYTRRHRLSTESFRRDGGLMFGRRCSEIKREMRDLRLRGVIRSGGGGGRHDDASQQCARCRKKFVWLLNSARVCVQCGHRVCDKCCQQLAHKRWICCLCIKQLYNYNAL